MKRPTHESDMLKVVLSDDVAPSFVQYLAKHRGNFVAALIDFSANIDKEWWKNLEEYVAFCEEVRKYFERLHEEGRPIKRDVLLRIREVAMRYDENVRNNKFLVLLSSLAGIKVDVAVLPEYAKSVRVYRNDGGWWKKIFELPIAD